MRIALFGGTRGTGRQVLLQALQNDWGVKLLARNPQAVPPEAGLEVIGGDALDPGKVIMTITGCDAVVSCIGPAGRSRYDRAVCSSFTEILIPAMNKFSITRVVAVSSMGVGSSAAQIPLLLRPLFATLFKGALLDKEKQELLLQQSPLEWTIIRPGGLTDKPTGVQPTIGTDLQTRAGRIERKDVAAFVIRELESAQYLRQTPYIT